MTRRVVVTGMGGVTALGEDWPAIRARMRNGETGIRRMDDWDRFSTLNTRLGGPIEGFSVDARYPRKLLRSMGTVSRMAVYAAEKAIEDARLKGDTALTDGRTGVAFGSSFGSPPAVLPFTELMQKGSSTGLTANSYVQFMPHTTAVAVGLTFGLKGRIIPTSSACTSGSQAIGYAYEAIRFGRQDLMVAGGADELSVTFAAVFDTLYATSTRNDEPHLSPRPFDAKRDGLVVGEGAGALVLEEYEHARARGAQIHAEILGFGSNSDGNHVTQPTADTMQSALRLALKDAALDPAAIGYVSAHGTATEWGDVAETAATAAVLGDKVPISTLKGHFGHTMGACGAIEAWLGIAMMNEDWFAPTANLETVDPRCRPLDYVTGAGRDLKVEHMMSNNFAFGGVNTSLIFKRGSSVQP